MAHKIFLVCGAIQILPCALYVELNYTSPLLVNSPLICRQDIYSVQLTLKVMFSTDHYRVPPQPHALSYISGRPTLTQEKLFTALDLAALLRLLLRDRALPMLYPMLAGPLRRLHATTYSSLISSRRVHQRISSQNVSPDNPAADIYRDFNHLKNFILAFPSTELLKRKAPDS
jgi:hypothetical protein